MMIYTPAFIRGTVQRTPFTVDGDHVYEWDIAIRTMHRTIHVLDTIPRLTDELQIDPHRQYTCVISPFLADEPSYHPPTDPPEGIGRYEDVIWWEVPFWWGGIVRDLHWQFSANQPTLVTHADLMERDWVVVETPVGDIVMSNLGNILKAEVGGVITWSRISWFGLHALIED